MTRAPHVPSAYMRQSLRDSVLFATPGDWWSDGTRVIIFSGEELVVRLSALVPPPRMHLVHDFGVLAPNARLRRLVVPEPSEEGADDPCGHSVAYNETRNGRTIRRRWVPWAQLLLNVFSVDVMSCPRCDSRMQRIAVIEQPSVITAILNCLSRKERPP